MLVLTLTAVPAGLRGDLTKWLSEISPGVFVGKPSARIRDLLWNRVVELCSDGRAIMVYSADNEQGVTYRTHRHDWTAEDFDGVILMRRPAKSTPAPRKTGWSTARNYRRSLSPSWAQRSKSDRPESDGGDASIP